MPHLHLLNMCCNIFSIYAKAGDGHCQPTICIWVCSARGRGIVPRTLTMPRSEEEQQDYDAALQALNSYRCSAPARLGVAHPAMRHAMTQSKSMTCPKSEERLW